MTSSRLLFLSVLLFGIAATAAFHASGALSHADARFATCVDGSIATYPPAPVTSRFLAVAADLVRAVWAPTSLFRALHLSCGILLAFAAAISAIVAARLASPAGGVAAAVFVGGAMALGAGFAESGRSAHPAAVLLVLLSGAAWAWTADRPRPALGGLLLGLAAAEHPLVLFTLPGFGAFALQASLRATPADSAAVVRRSLAGFLAGFCAVFLPILDAGNSGLLHVSAPRTPFAALAAWASAGDGAFWSLRGPEHWPGGARDAALAVWRNAGALGALLGLGALVAFFGGAARWARPFLVVHVFVAAAFVLGDPADDATAAVLLAWPFLFWTLPSFAALETRLAGRGGDPSRAAAWTPAISALALAALFVANAKTIDRSAEKGIEWAETVIRTLPDDAILLTSNPVVVAAAADGLRPDVDVIDVVETSTMTAFRSGRMLLPLGSETPARELDPETLVVLVHATEGGRSVFLDPSVYYAPGLRETLVGERWVLAPHGLAFRLLPPGFDLDGAPRRAASLAWDDANVTPGTPPSVLRDDLGGSEYFARSLLQSAFLHLEQKRPEDAEREFLLALGHPAANPNVAAMGYAKVLNATRNYSQIALTLERYIRDDMEGAWIARQLQGNNLLRLGQRDRGLAMLQRALRLAPSARKEEKARLLQSIRNLEAKREDTATPESG